MFPQMKAKIQEAMGKLEGVLVRLFTFDSIYSPSGDVIAAGLSTSFPALSALLKFPSFSLHRCSRTPSSALCWSMPPVPWRSSPSVAVLFIPGVHSDANFCRNRIKVLATRARPRTSPKPRRRLRPG